MKRKGLFNLSRVPFKLSDIRVLHQFYSDNIIKGRNFKAIIIVRKRKTDLNKQPVEKTKYLHCKAVLLLQYYSENFSDKYYCVPHVFGA